MFDCQKTKERTCAFYASDYHFEMVSLPYISKKLENQDEIIILTENDLEKTVKLLVDKVELKEEKKKDILKISWKNDDEKKLEKIEKNINSNKNTTIFIKGKEKYINNINKNLAEIIKNKENVKIVDCYDIQEIGDNLDEIMSKYKMVLGTLGEKEIEKL